MRQPFVGCWRIGCREFAVAIAEKAGARGAVCLEEPGRGILFSLAVTEAYGLYNPKKSLEEK